MVSMLYAFPGSRLYNRLRQEGRLLPIDICEHAYGGIDFEPKMGINTLRQGHLYVLDAIYSPELYFQRLVTFLDHFKLPKTRRKNIQPEQLWLLLKVIKDLGISDNGRWYFWKIIGYGFRKQYRALPLIIRLMVTGFNFRRDIASYHNILSATEELP